MNIDLTVVARDLRLPPEKIERSVQLLDEGNTIPFITRFRKDQTGGLNEEQLLAIKQHVASLRTLAERKAFIKKSIESQSKLTEGLAKEIERATTSRRLEDLYHPFKAKKQSRAQTARHQGLEPLAEEIFAGSNPEVDMSSRATDYVRVDKGLTSVDEVIKGVGDLLAERFAEDSELRSKLRKVLWETGSLVSQSATPNDSPAPAKAAKPKGKNAAKQKKAEPETNSDDKDAAATAAAPNPAAIDKAKVAEPTTSVTSKPETVPSESAATESAPAESAATESAPTEAVTVTPTEATKTESETLTPAPKTEQTPAADIDKTKLKMSAAENESPETANSSEEIKTEEHAPLKPTEASQEPPTVVTDPAADSPVVETETPKESTGKETTGKEASPTDTKKPAAVTDTTTSAAETAAATSATATAAAPAKKKRKKKKKKKKSDTAFKDYYDFKQPIKSLPHHQILAVNRGERSNRLKVKIAYDEKQITDLATEHLVPAEHPFKSFLDKCVQDALSRLVIPSLEREIRRELTEKSEKHAVDVFAANLKNLLLTPPLRNRQVMAIDPGFKSGCSVAILDNQGQLLTSDHVFVVGNKERRDESRQKVASLVKEHNVDMIAIGNGVGCRETEQMVSDAIAEFLTDHPVRYVIVNEAGASIYSTSEVGREELPDQTPAVRSAISIGRRLQNPISELVKISPANIGVGMYQHDVKAKHLSESLDEVVHFCVNRVGVDVNSASPSLLKFVSGMNALTARRVYEFCKENSGIKNRQQLKEVSGLGDATFVQAAGFLRIRDGDNPLDSTSIHPESYPIAEDIIKRADSTPAELFAFRKPAAAKATPPLSVETAAPTDTATATEPKAPKSETLESETPAISESEPAAGETPNPVADAAVDAAAPQVPLSTKRKEIIDRITSLDLDAIATENNVGKMLMTDLVRAIKKPLWDPRDKISKPISRRGILKADDLKPEMQLEAQVVNVVDFGVFVDIGLGESCLVHVSQLSTRYISDPQVVYSVGDILRVWVSEIDGERRRVKLTAIRPGTMKEVGRRRRPKDGEGAGGRPKRKDGKPAHARPTHARPKFERKKTERRPPAKPKKVIPITDEMLKGDAPMRSFSDLLQFKSKSPEDEKKNGEK